MKKNRFYLVTKQDEDWVNVDKRGYAHEEYARFNAEQLSRRGGGQQVGLMRAGKILDIFYNGQVVVGL